MSVHNLVEVVERMCAAGELHVAVGQAGVHDFCQRLGRGCGQEVRLVLRGVEHAPNDVLHLLVGVFAVGCQLGALRGEHHLDALLPGFLYLLQIA